MGSRRDRSRVQSWRSDETREERRVLDTMRGAQLPFLAWASNAALLPFQFLAYWNTWNPKAQLFFSGAALAYAALLATKGWSPWRMPMYRVYGDGDADWWRHAPTAIAIRGFFLTPRVKWMAVAITASAALTPWLLTILSRLVSPGPIDQAKSTWLPPFGQAVLGYADGVRAGTLAMLWMRRELRQNWDNVRRTASIGSVDEPSITDGVGTTQSEDSVGAFLHKRGISRGKAIFWLLATLVLLGILAYLRGYARRQGI